MKHTLLGLLMSVLFGCATAIDANATKGPASDSAMVDSSIDEANNPALNDADPSGAAEVSEASMAVDSADDSSLPDVTSKPDTKPLYDSAIFDIGKFDGPSCLTTKCGAKSACCAKTGLCYPTLCLSCCIGVVPLP
ncbi:MAG: hypothetical protein NVS3B20_10550 [Polyangiales bacterium]